MGFADTSSGARFAPEKMQKVGLFETSQMFADLYCLEPGQSQRPHTHEGATKLYLVLEGHGRFLIGDERRELGPGGLAWAAPGEPHGVENPGPERLVCFVSMAPNPNR